MYNDLLDNYEFCRLPDSSKWLAVGLLLLASRTNNQIPADSDWINQKLSCTEPPNLEQIIEAGFIEPAGCKHDAGKSLALARTERSREETEKTEIGERGTGGEDLGISDADIPF